MKYYSAQKRNDYQVMRRHEENLNAYYWVKEANLKTTYHMIPTIWHSGKCITMNTVKGSVVVRDEFMWYRESGGHRGFLRQWNYSASNCNSGYVITHFSKPIECVTPRVSPNVNYGLCMIMMCQWRFIVTNTMLRKKLMWHKWIWPKNWTKWILNA